jgi:hypothetical protein
VASQKPGGLGAPGREFDFRLPLRGKILARAAEKFEFRLVGSSPFFFTENMQFAHTISAVLFSSHV